MASIAERILEAIRYVPLNDDELAQRLGVAPRQSINQAAHILEGRGLIRRTPGPDGKLVNVLIEPGAALPAAASSVSVISGQRANPVTEDEVKAAIRDHLEALGFEVEVAWGQMPGIDVDARHPDGRRYVIEAKAEKSQNGPQQHNYFVGMLGELVQRMSDPDAKYGIAIPDNRQYRGLVDRLPRYASEQLGLVVFWVTRDGAHLAVEVEET